MADLIRDSVDAAAPPPQSPFYNDISSQIFISKVLRGEKLL